MLLLFWEFFKVGIIGYGGGPGSIALIQAVVQHTGWMSMEQFAEVLTVTMALPGPIATKLSGYVGFKVAGVPGLIVALLGEILPSLLILLFLFRWIILHRSDPVVQGLIRGAGPVVIAILAVLVIQLIPGSIKGWREIVIALGAFALIYFAKLPQALVIVLGLAAGAAFLR